MNALFDIVVIWPSSSNNCPAASTERGTPIDTSSWRAKAGSAMTRRQLPACGTALSPTGRPRANKINHLPHTSFLVPKPLNRGVLDQFCTAVAGPWRGRWSCVRRQSHHHSDFSHRASRAERRVAPKGFASCDGGTRVSFESGRSRSHVGLVRRHAHKLS
jgi:hypothetical protein